MCYNINLCYFNFLYAVVPTRLGLSKRSSDQRSGQINSTRPVAETQTNDDDIAASSLHRQLNLHNHVCTFFPNVTFLNVTVKYLLWLNVDF